MTVIGWSNMGKSTLLSKLIGQRLSIVEDTPGVTEDRTFDDYEWRNHKFSLVDTDGTEPESRDIILPQMRAQAQLAIDLADVIIMVTDLHFGVVAADAEVTVVLQRNSRPVILCVNRCDRIGELSPEFYEPYNLGFGEPVAVLSVHGRGTGDLLDRVVKFFPGGTGEEDEGEIIRVAVIGKFNVGESSLISYVVGEDRSIVLDVVGTTRDTIDIRIENESGTLILIDIVGIRRRNKVGDSIERYSVPRTETVIKCSSVYVIVTDATAGFTEQDSEVADRTHEAGKGCVAAANKRDAVERDGYTMNDYRKQLGRGFFLVLCASVIFISAHTEQRADKLFETIHYVASMNLMCIGTGIFNDILTQAMTCVQLPMDKGKCLKIHYMIQAPVKPPTFIHFINSVDLFHFSYQRHLKNRIRETFGLEGTPIRMVVRERESK